MNKWPEVMDVLPGYPEKEDGDDTCNINESNNDLGPSMCKDNSQCKGDRICKYGLWYCIGYSNCADDLAEESVAKRQINEELNPWGPSECDYEFHCKGDRTCGSDLKCEGVSNCPGEMTPEQKCMIDEMKAPSGLPSSCTNDNECRGERTCGSDGMCTGYCNCP